MSFQASAWVIEHSAQKGSSLLCLLMIANHANSTGMNSFPSVDTLAKECRMSARQITRIIHDLEASGELIVERSAGRKAHTFTVVMGQCNPDKLSKSTLTSCPPAVANPDKSDTPTLTNPTPNPDKSARPLYDAGALDFEQSLEQSEEKRERRADAPPAPSKTGSSKTGLAKNPGSAKPYSPELTAFWTGYPPGGRARGSLSETNSVWANMTPGDRDAAGRGLRAALSNAQFCEFPPAPHRWLKARRWETFLDGLPIDAPLPGPPPRASPRPVDPMKAGLGAAAEYEAERMQRKLAEARQ